MTHTENIGPVKIFFGKFSTFPYCNTLLIRDRQTLLVDPACEEESLRLLAAQERIDFLFATHYHPDHIRHMGLFGGRELLVHRADAPCFRSLDSMAEWVGVKGTIYEKEWKTSMIKDFGFREREAVTEVEEGMTLGLGELSIQFVHLPGHTPGHTGFCIPELETLFIADLELSAAGPWYHNKRADIQSIIDSVEKIRKIPAAFYIPSHGREIFRGDLGPRLDHYLENIFSREKKILETLSVPRSLDELTSLGLISGSRLSEKQVWFLFERNMVEKHLDRLLTQGKISRKGERYQREA